jgi:hypothetical protein
MLKRRVGLQHCFRIDRQCFNDLSGGRQLIAWAQDALYYGTSYLLHQLCISRRTGARVEPKVNRYFTTSLRK